jgi:hypothetical protein
MYAVASVDRRPGINCCGGAVEAGDSYATTGQIGIRFVDLEVSGTGIQVTLGDATDDLGWSTDDLNPRLFTTYFIGEGGRLLS